VNVSLGIAFVILGLTATLLQYWLWTFPMEPDPKGIDPHGRTTAPLVWRWTHRVLGYGFLGIYLYLMSQMLPRLPFLGEKTADLTVWLHVGLGIMIGALLIAKVVILRIWQRFGNRLRLIGTLLFFAALLAIGLVASRATRLSSLPVSNEDDRMAKRILESRCLSCHGASPILRNDDEWPEVLEEMREIARESGRPDPVGDDGYLIARYLERVLPPEKEEDEDD